MPSGPTAPAAGRPQPNTRDACKVLEPLGDRL